jgi:hypothetical protein
LKQGNGTTAAHLRDLPVFLRAPRAAGLWLVGVLITLASVVAFGLSYRGLFEWALHHQWPVAVAVFFPLLIDVLIVVCEVILFVAAIDGDTPWHVRALAWLVLLVFTGISVVGNADHAATANALSRAGFALPPLVLAVALAFGLGELKRQAAKYSEDVAGEGSHQGDASSSPATRPVSARVSLPGPREIQRRRKCSPTTAKKIRAELELLARSFPDPSAAYPDTGAAGASGQGTPSSPGALAALSNGQGGG